MMIAAASVRPVCEVCGRGVRSGVELARDLVEAREAFCAAVSSEGGVFASEAAWSELQSALERADAELQGLHPWCAGVRQAERVARAA